MDRPHTPRHLDIHIVLNNLSTHKSEPVRTWLAYPRRTLAPALSHPTLASWLNLVEAWFLVLLRKALAQNRGIIYGFTLLWFGVVGGVDRVRCRC